MCIYRARGETTEMHADLCTRELARKFVTRESAVNAPECQALQSLLGCGAGLYRLVLGTGARVGV